MRLLVSVSMFIRLANYFMNHWTQLINMSKHKNGFNLVRFTKPNFDVVVAETAPQNIPWAKKDLAWDFSLILLMKFDQNGDNSVPFH